MLDTEGRTGPDCQFHISADQGDLRFAGGSGKAKRLSSLSAAVDPVLGDQCFVLLVEADGQIEAFCRQQGFFQDGRVHDGDTVICKACGSRGGKGIEIDRLFSLHALRDIGTAVEMDLFLLCPCQNVGEDRYAVHDRIGVGHEDYTRISAPCRRKGSGVQIFLVRVSGITEMRVCINEARRGAQPLAVKHAQ